MAGEDFQLLRAALRERAEKVRQYIFTKAETLNLQPVELKQAVTDYIRYGGKMLRPGVLLFACGAVGGDENLALPAAAATELFHTWTLVHDDIIDQDAQRRGQDALHIKYYKYARENPDFHLTDTQARDVGQAMSILAGDTQHGWSISLLTDLYFVNGLDPRVVLLIIRELDTEVLNILVSGETLDVVYAKSPIETLTEAQIVRMLWQKTGALYEFAGKAGAIIGLNTTDLKHPYVQAIATFTSKCGMAFQLLDDILGVIGDEKKLGKPVGSDIREGKKTIVLYQTLKNANATQKERIYQILGNGNNTAADYQEMVQLMHQLAGIETTRQMAHQFLNEALEALSIIPASNYKTLLESWAQYLIHREF